ncbi:MAG: prolyl oligopeptidase family serine peptidase [Chitinophagaceae bacterium]
MNFLKNLYFNLLNRLRVTAIFIIIMHIVLIADAQNSDINDTGYHRKIITNFFHVQASVRDIYQCVLNRNATAVAWCADNKNGQAIHVKSLLKKNDSAIQITAASSGEFCNETEPQWSPDGKEIAFLSDVQTPNQPQIFIANSATGKLIIKHPLTNFNGFVSHLKWSPDGIYLSVLYVEQASREPSPMAAENRSTGLIDSAINRNVQCIEIINYISGEAKRITPQQLYIFEYDWSPDSKSFVYTAAPPPGDDNWYIAKLYIQKLLSDETRLIYTPSKQIAVPRWSADGKYIAFIEGLMSDQGGTGGEIYMIDTISNSQPKNLTLNRTSTPSWFMWQPDGNILFTEFIGGSVAISALNTKSTITQTLWKDDVSIHASDEQTSLSVTNNKSSTTLAFIRSSWNALPEIWYGSFAKQTQLTHFNNAVHKPLLKTENITWINEGKHVQGWLLFPQNYDSTKYYPMLVCVHGGPAWITTPTWAAPDFNTTVYTQLGYFVFFPNPRGSYGQGESFVSANRRDWGFGDLRDIIGGVDTVLKKYSINSHHIGILGWSYGGAMAMFSITQTNRFKAAVAGAGACDWQSYYGQNSIDKWMWSYFGASPYDNPKAYAKVSAITYIKQAKTPTLVLVGERDGEAPPPQSFQFWHALKELHVPTQLIIYPDEGHEFEKFEDMIDVSIRTIEWFNTYMKR